MAGWNRQDRKICLSSCYNENMMNTISDIQDKKTKSSAFSFPKHTRLTGRGASAIYLVLSHELKKDREKGEKPEDGAREGKQNSKKKVMLAPANVCYAALYPALYAGWDIALCDVSSENGNLELEPWKEAVEKTKPDACLLVHMYGQPLEDLPEMVRICREKGILSIEDCASAMGAAPEYALGHQGDYSIFSTGYAKIVDAGVGGLLGSDQDDLSWVEEEQQALPAITEAIEDSEGAFSRIYRQLRNNNDPVFKKAVYKGLQEGSRHLFLYRLSKDEEEKVEVALKGLDEQVDARRDAFSFFRDRIEEDLNPEDKEIIEFYPYIDSAVPWRFSFMLPEPLHRPFIEACLEEGLPVSDWYPSVALMVQDEKLYPNAEKMERRIVNFPLDPKVLNHLAMTLEDLLEKAREKEKER